jgi:threonine dehydrogenase-like Zn-dependent dehydrogenase
MQAAIIHAPGQMDIEQWTKPQPDAGEVLVAVGAAGLCAGDMYFYLGKNPYAQYPQICGHEIAGTVVGIGSNVSDSLIGTRVAVEPFISCGKCYPCRIGKGNCCTNLQIIGVHKPGGFADYVVAPASLIYPIPDGLSLVEASFAEPVAIALQTLRRGDVGAEDILIMGCGPIGLALIEVATARGGRVFVSDHHLSRLALAAKLGAVILPSDEELLKAVMEYTNGEGMPVIIEATGSTAAIEMTPHLVAAGGRIVIVSLLNQGMMVSLPGFELIRKEMTILGSRASYQCFPEALQLLADQAIRYTESASTFPLRNAPEVFSTLAADKSRVQKAVFVMEGE